MELNFITSSVLFDVRESVAYITLNDPAQMNPVTAEVMRDLIQCLNYCERESDVRAIVLRGARRKLYGWRQCQGYERAAG